MKTLCLSRLALLVLTLLLAASSSSTHASDAPKQAYETSFANITKISAELHLALAPAKRSQVHGELVLLESGNIPCITPAVADRNGSAANIVRVSAGFVEWINRASHARALDESKEGTFTRYLTAATPGSNGEFPAVGKDLAPEILWSFDTMNHQAGIFNQMSGALLAIDMAHHYLGHYKKHSARLAAISGASTAISSLLSEKEWREAVMQGARNALDCGLGVDGLRAIFDGFDMTSSRPTWSAHLVHPKANLGKLSRELEKMENDFFLVEK